MKTLASRVNIIPVVAKSDALSKEELDTFKKQVGADIAQQNLPVFDFQKFGSTENISSVYLML